MLDVGIYPGSFDPITYGHLDIIDRGSKVFGKLIVAVLVNLSKNTLFTPEERVIMIKDTIRHLPNVEVVKFDGLLVDFAKKRGAKVILKGLRAVSDFEYEFQMALMNKKLDKDVETMFIMTNSKYSYLSSTIVKEVSQFGGCINDVVPKNVALCLKRKQERQ